MKLRSILKASSRACRGRSGAASQGGGCLGGGAAVLLLFMGFCGSLSDSGSSPSSSVYQSGISSSYAPSYSAPQPRETFYIHGALNLRGGAGKNFGVVRTLSRGERVQLGPKDANGWAPMYDGYGSAVGYVYRASDNVRSYAPSARRPRQPRQRSSHPAGASAICQDGTYSYSANRRGTCSWHGGVRQWL